MVDLYPILMSEISRALCDFEAELAGVYGCALMS